MDHNRRSRQIDNTDVTKNCCFPSEMVETPKQDPSVAILEPLMIPGFHVQRACLVDDDDPCARRDWSIG